MDFKQTPPLPRAGFGSWMAALFLLSFCLYLATAPPGFLFDDNPEFITAAHTLGIAHPPGYPLFALFGKLFSLLTAAFPPLGINFTSAFFGALGACMLGRAIWRLTGSPTTAGAFTLFLIVSHTFWSQSIEAEVYAPNIFFIGLLFNLLLEFDENRDPRTLSALCVIGVLSLLNHYTTVLVLPVMAVYLVLAHRRDLSPLRKAAAPGLFALAATLSVLFYLPLRSAADPAANWGATHALSGFLHHLRGVETMAAAPKVPFIEKWKFIADYFKLALSQAPWPCYLFLFTAAISLVLRRGKGALILCLYLVSVFGFIAGLNYLYGPRGSYVVSFFYITSFFFMFMIIALGADELLTRLQSKNSARMRNILLLFPAILITYSCVRHMPSTNKIHDTIATNYGRNMLLTLDRDSVIFSPNVVESFPLSALRSVYGMRRDIIIYGKLGDADNEAALKTDPNNAMMPGGNPAQGKRESLLVTLTAQQPVYFTMGAVINRPDLFPMLDGLLYRLHTTYEPPSTPDRWARYDMSGLDLKRKDYDYLTRYVVTKYYLLLGAEWLQRGLDGEANDMFARVVKFNPQSQFLRLSLATLYLRKSRIDDALREYEAAMKLPPEEVEASLIALAIYNNAGELYRLRGRWNSALHAFKEAEKLAPKNPLTHFQLGRTYYDYAEWLNANDNRQAYNAYKSAITHLEKTDKLGGGNESVYTVLGICNEQIGKFTAAENYYRLAMDPYGGATGDPAVYRHAGIFYADKIFDYDKAVKLFETFLERAPSDPEADRIRIKLASIYIHLKNYEKAIQHLTGTVRNYNNFSPYEKTAVSYYGALAYDGRGEPDKALLMFMEGIRKETDLPEIHRDFGRFLERQYQNHKPAIDEMQKYLLLVPGARDRYKVEGDIAVIKEKLDAESGKSKPASKRSR